MTRKIVEPLLLLALSIPALGLAVAWGPLGYPVGAMFLALLGGWLNVVQRALAQADMNRAGIASGMLSVVLTVLMLHYFAAWIYREVRVKNERADWPAAWRWRWTLCLTAAVMMMFIAGLVGVGLFRTTSWFLETSEMFKRTPRSIASAPCEEPLPSSS